MATLNPAVPVMQPDNRLSNFSQGTDKASLQPLAEVPKLSEKYVQPDYKTDTTGGKLFQGLGDLVKDGTELADGIIKKNIDDTLNDGLGKIRDSFGVAQAADIGSGFAAAVGKGGQDDNTSLTADNNGQPPVALQKLGTQIDGLTEANRQGQLSNSAYYAKMEAYVRQVKQQFPGYSDDVDQMTSAKLGVTPANALRSAIQQDVQQLQNKVTAQADKWSTYEKTNAQYIYTQWPNYDQLKANGQAPSRTDVMSTVGTLQARDYSYTAQNAKLAASKATDNAISDNAVSIATQKAGDIANHLSVGFQNTLGIKTPADFTQLLDDVRSGKRPPLTPDEKQQAAGVFANLEQQYGIAFDKFINHPLNDHTTETLASKTSPDKLNPVRAQGMQSLVDIKNGLLDDKYGVMAQSANWSKATNEAGEADFLRRAPIAPYVAAGRKALGDQGIMTLTAQQPFMVDSMLEGFRQFNQAAATTGDKSLREVLDTYKTEKVNDGKLNKVAIADTANIILHADKMSDPTAGPNAVKHAFGPGNNTLMEAFDSKNQIPVFNDLVSRPMVEKIKKMDQTSQKTFTTGAETMFTDVYTAQVSQANQTADNYNTQLNGGLKVIYDPESANFRFEGPATAPKIMIQAANGKLAGLNSAINSMKEVFKMEGRDPTQALYGLLPVAGIEPGTPLYKALQTEFLKTQGEPGK